ncbi:MAG: hypothetical protein A2005_03220 [Desulfuromonadales bacterium GWC2_61_20]|nr:MAG: hypothetical protein A2005_03220 [Desulfuromonadales bacterium GWC2_61_20]
MNDATEAEEAAIGKVVHVELTSPQHLYWPEVDVDLEVESVLFPERYPLVSRGHEKGEGYRAAEGKLDGQGRKSK